MKVAIYARVSTTNGQDPELQLRELREYCQRRGWEVAGEYVDVGISGAREQRQQLNRLIADAHRRRFDAVVVWKFDRFARSVLHLLRALETFRSLGIDFASLSEQVDTSTPTGKMVFTVLGAVAECVGFLNLVSSLPQATSHIDEFGLFREEHGKRFHVSSSTEIKFLRPD